MGIRVIRLSCTAPTIANEPQTVVQKADLVSVACLLVHQHNESSLLGGQAGGCANLRLLTCCNGI